MKEAFKIHKNMLPKAQQRLWEELAQVPNCFSLYGGTAIALYLGHRESIDFDFFAMQSIDPEKLLNTLPFLKNAVPTQIKENTLDVIVERDGKVKVSFFGLPDLPQLRQPHIVEENGLKIAHMLDLTGMKISVIQKRSEAKDYIDLDAIFQAGQIDLPTALAAGRAIYGTRFSPEISLKALCYFKDGNLEKLPEDVRLRLVEAVRAVDVYDLPKIETSYFSTHEIDEPTL